MNSLKRQNEELTLTFHEPQNRTAYRVKCVTKRHKGRGLLRHDLLQLLCRYWLEQRGYLYVQPLCNRHVSLVSSPNLKYSTQNPLIVKPFAVLISLPFTTLKLTSAFFGRLPCCLLHTWRRRLNFFVICPIQSVSPFLCFIFYLYPPL